MPYETIGIYRGLCVRRGMAPSLCGLADWWRREGKRIWHMANTRSWPRRRQAAATAPKATMGKLLPSPEDGPPEPMAEAAPPADAEAVDIHAL